MKPRYINIMCSSEEEWEFINETLRLNGLGRSRCEWNDNFTHIGIATTEGWILDGDKTCEGQDDEIYYSFEEFREDPETILVIHKLLGDI